MVVWAGKPSEALSRALVTLGMVPYGTVTHAEDPAIRTSEDGIHPQWGSVKHPAAAIFKVAITCHSGAIGVEVTEQ